MRSRSIGSLAVAAVMLLSGSTAAGAVDSGGPRNIVLVQGNVDNEQHSATRVQFAADHDTTVTEVNLALAKASCTDCRTVAVAFQLVLFDGDVTNYQPKNLAFALNDECIRCRTFAYAFQWVRQTDRHVFISPSARARLQALEQLAADEAASDDEPFDQLEVKLDGLAAQMVAVLDAEVGASTRPGWQGREVASRAD